VSSGWARPGTDERDGAADPARPPRSVEPLTGRELAVLRLLAVGRSNQRIAHDLVVTLDTVKST